MSQKLRLLIYTVIIIITSIACQTETWESNATRTSMMGEKWTPVSTVNHVDKTVEVKLNPDITFQSITGMGGAFTESSAHLLNHVSNEVRDSVLQAYFGQDGCRYTLTRTHMNSCDFSLNSYSYTPVENDTALVHFSITEDEGDLIPMIKDAQAISESGFKVIASPWTAAPWMKDNNAWFGGKLKPEYYDAWASFFVKYIEAYQDQGIDIWAVTVENEPLGNDSHWESMHYTPEEMGEFVANHLGPQFKRNSIGTHILLYDQNRGEELNEWADVLLTDSAVTQYTYGTAVHWYNSTYDWFPQSLQYVHQVNPNQHIIQTEGCVDAEVPHWNDDEWYWKKEATDWGWDWAAPENKHRHPKYVPAYRYARDIIGCFNNEVEGWVDWNMVLDQYGGPNHASNWCVAPVLIDTLKNETYFTPLYYVMGQFSRYIRPEAKRIQSTFEEREDLMLTSVINPDGSIVTIALNTGTQEIPLRFVLNGESFDYLIPGGSVQTVVFNK